MKGVNFIIDEKNRRKAVIIELKTIERYQEEIEDLLDVIIAESRKDEPKRSWDDVKKSLKKKRKYE
jgi:alkyl hydroperoxide reductase subunit AhpC